MNQEQFAEALIGKKIQKINFVSQDINDAAIESIRFESGELLTLAGAINLSHPEQEAEQEAFYEVLKHIPANGIITFKAEYLTQSLIDREISGKHKEIKSNGYGQIPTTRQGHISYRFDMP